MIVVPTRFPPPGLLRQPGSAAWRRQCDGPSHQGPSPLFRLGSVTPIDVRPPVAGWRWMRGPDDRRAESVTGDLDGPLEQPLDRAQAPFGLVDRGDEVLALAAEVTAGQVGDSPSVRGDRLGRRAELGRG